MSSLAANITYAILQGFFLLGLLAAWFNKMATVSQMFANGVKKGMPYLWHLGMWNDAITVHAFLALVVGLFGSQWMSGYWGVAMIGGAILYVWLSYLANGAWVKPTDIIQSHAGVADDKIHSTGEMSSVGWIHVPHMAIILTIIAMFVIWVLRGLVPWKLAVGGICLLLAHACIGQHGMLREMNPSWNPWPQQSFDGIVLFLNAVFFALAFLFLFSYFLDQAA